MSIAAAANALPPDKAGARGPGLLNSSQQLGSALGLAILSTVAISRTNTLIAADASHDVAYDAGYHRALLVGSILMVAARAHRYPYPQHSEAAPLVMVDSESLPSRCLRDELYAGVNRSTDELAAVKPIPLENCNMNWSVLILDCL